MSPSLIPSRQAEQEAIEVLCTKYYDELLREREENSHLTFEQHRQRAAHAAGLSDPIILDWACDMAYLDSPINRRYFHDLIEAWQSARTELGLPPSAGIPDISRALVAKGRASHEPSDRLHAKYRGEDVLAL